MQPEHTCSNGIEGIERRYHLEGYEVDHQTPHSPDTDFTPIFREVVVLTWLEREQFDNNKSFGLYYRTIELGTAKLIKNTSVCVYY